MPGGRKPWKWDSNLPGDLVPTATALKVIDRDGPNCLWWRRDTGALHPYHMGYQYGWSLAELVTFLMDRDGLTMSQAYSKITPDVLAAVVDLGPMPPDPVGPGDAAAMLGMTNSWFRAKVAAGEVPFAEVAGQRVFSRSKLRALARRRQSAKAPA